MLFRLIALLFIFNGFAVAIGNGDVVISLQLNGKPSMLLNSSYTVAKTLGESLLSVISDLEEKTGSKIMTTHVIADAMSKQYE
ncbi:MAG: hypothetical protein MZV65_43025 [Chromatiales bacterium]|nr:hypothetical protein [Chromatiales bacterium]